MTVYIAALAACVLLSGFFSASEISLTSASRMRLESALESGDRRAARALKLTDRFDMALSTILIGNNLVNIAASSLGSVIAILLASSANLSEGLCTTAATVIVTVAVIMFGETAPKIVAKKNAVRFSLAFSGPLWVLSLVLRPFVWCVVKLVELLCRPLRGEASADAEAGVDELQSIIETAEDEAVLDEDQSELMQAALDFSDISVGEVMTARVDMQAIDADDDWETILRTVESSAYTRLPVYQNDTDNIIGVLHLNAFYRALLDGAPVDIRPLLTEPCWVYRTVKLPAALELMRRRQTHLAIVTDEYGGTAGVVSMEDILESLVGDIWDDTDEVEPEVVSRDDDCWELDGDMSVSDFVELVGLEEDSFDFESETVGGWTMEMFGGFPEPGQSFTYAGLTVTVLERADKRVEKLLVRREAADAAEKGTNSD